MDMAALDVVEESSEATFLRRLHAAADWQTMQP